MSAALDRILKIAAEIAAREGIFEDEGQSVPELAVGERGISVP